LRSLRTGHLPLHYNGVQRLRQKPHLIPVGGAEGD